MISASFPDRWLLKLTCLMLCAAFTEVHETCSGVKWDVVALFCCCLVCSCARIAVLSSAVYFASAGARSQHFSGFEPHGHNFGMYAEQFFVKCTPPRLARASSFLPPTTWTIMVSFFQSRKVCSCMLILRGSIANATLRSFGCRSIWLNNS